MVTQISKWKCSMFYEIDFLFFFLMEEAALHNFFSDRSCKLDGNGEGKGIQ